MGVKSIWRLIEEHDVKEEMTLSEWSETHARSKRIAVDMAIWRSAAKNLSTSKLSCFANPLHYIIFCRVVSASRAGVSLVCVSDGKTNVLKLGTVVKRSKTGASIHQGVHPSQDGGPILQAMGVPLILAEDDGEGTCAAMQITGIVDAVASCDFDSFLYGATQVIKTMSTGNGAIVVELYRLERIQEKLMISGRNSLIAMAMLIGQDMCPKGLLSIGSKRAMSFVRQFNEDNVLDALRALRHSNPPVKIPAGRNESPQEFVQRKASASDGSFPDEKVIQEFLRGRTVDAIAACGKPPDCGAIDICMARATGWDSSRTNSRVLPLLTAWTMGRMGHGDIRPALHPIRIAKKHVLKGRLYYDVAWARLEDEIHIGVTLEEGTTIDNNYPALAESFKETIPAKPRKRKLITPPIDTFFQAIKPNRSRASTSKKSSPALQASVLDKSVDDDRPSYPHFTLPPVIDLCHSSSDDEPSNPPFTLPPFIDLCYSDSDDSSN